jgi:septum formation protein
MIQPLFVTRKKIILASESPRRQAFLKELDLTFTVIPASIDETPLSQESAVAFVQRMSTEKAKSIAELHPGAFVIGADTIISFQGEILGKPADPHDALRILQKLQGTSHEVITSLSLCCIQKKLSTTIIRTTRVTFDSFSKETLKAYIRSGEPMDKAGAYAIQGQGGFLVQKIDGSCSNVIGLPMNDLIRLLLTYKIIFPLQNHQIIE